MVYPGANSHVAEDALAGAAIDTGDVVVAQLEINREAVIGAFEIGRAKGAKTILNPSPVDPNIEVLLGQTDVVIANEHEAEVIGGVHVDSSETALRCGKAIMARGPQTVIVTIGSEGAVFCSEDHAYWVKPPAVQVSDTQGAGDAFLGAFIVRSLAGGASKDAMRYAVSVSAYCVTQRGSTQVSLPTRSDPSPEK